MEKREYCMKETKVYPQSEADQDFAKLLKNIRTEEKVSLDQLAMGLMSASQLVKIENGERPINKNIRDRLLICHKSCGDRPQLFLKKLKKVLDI